MLFRTKATLISLLALAAIAPAALAAGGPGLPKPDDTTIVPGVSIGGVSVGQPFEEAEAAWGNTGACKTTERLRQCKYGSWKRGIASIAGIDGELELVSLAAPNRRNEWRFNGPLMDFGTEKGNLGLGDRIKRIAELYPEGKRKGRFLFFDEGGVRMAFFSNRGRVVQIGLVSKQL